MNSLAIKLKRFMPLLLKWRRNSGMPVMVISFPVITDTDEMKRVWDLRKAGLEYCLISPGKGEASRLLKILSVLPELYPDYMRGVHSRY
ncbi:MAG: hypothetical protein MZV63_60655 [Marinilabiliales bacterium]|nr:hypothetical protein [Marinilabiliales bacterium]